MTETTGLYIDGVWRGGAGARFASTNPATGDTVWEGASATEADVADAVSAARGAFAGWARASLEDRRIVVGRFKAALEARKDALADLIARETGKPAWEGAAEAGAMIAKVDISITAQDERAGARTSDTAFGSASLAHKPHGVMAVFGPYNFPGHLPNGHIVPALLAGNTVVLKPSELTPGVGAAMVEAWAEAGAPAGVVNLVQGARETGGALLNSPIDGLLFTGSVDTGVLFHRHFAGRPEVILALEMGGNNPLIVWDAADVEAAAVIALQSAFITTGQRCSCARRLILPTGPFGDAVLEALLALVARIRVGRWDADPEPFMGPLISAAAVDATLHAQDRLAATGGKVLLRAQRLDQGAAFISPGVVDVSGTEPDDREVFGPLLSVFREPSFDAALARANATRFGLSAGLVSDDAGLWDQFARDIRAGVVNWNRPTTGAASSMPFGGPGLSGNHRPSAYYAADYCAYPMASQVAPAVASIPTKGLTA